MRARRRYEQAARDSVELARIVRARAACRAECRRRTEDGSFSHRSHAMGTSSNSPTSTPRVRAPDFPGTLDQVNTGGRALSLADLRGKIVLLDFWTYG